MPDHCCSLWGLDQLTYEGNTSACLPHIAFPDGWHVTCTPNHWSNEKKMKDYLEHIIEPYVQGKRAELKLAPDHPALQYLMCSKASRRLTLNILTK